MAWRLGEDIAFFLMRRVNWRFEGDDTWWVGSSRFARSGCYSRYWRRNRVAGNYLGDRSSEYYCCLDESMHSGLLRAVGQDFNSRLTLVGALVQSAGAGAGAGAATWRRVACA